MALVLDDRVRETTTVTSTGTATLLGAVTGYQSFSVIGNGNTTYYCISGQGTPEWEVGIGTYTLSSTTLDRIIVLSSSNAGNLVNFSAGIKDVICVYPSKKSVYLDASGNVNALGTPPSINLVNGTGIQYNAFKNRLINGFMRTAQRAVSATVTAGTSVPTINTGYPCVDRWFVYSTGANVTAAQVAGSGIVQNRLQITGAASVTAIGIGQRIENVNSIDMAGGNAVLSVDISNSLLTTVTWTAYYANTTNTFGTIGTPSKTQIATGSWTVTSSIVNYSAVIAISAAATTGIEILFTVGAQTSGTWVIGNVQLEKGSIQTNIDYRDFESELIRCQRHLLFYGSLGRTLLFPGLCYSTTHALISVSTAVTMFGTPTIDSATVGIISNNGTFVASTSVTFQSYCVNILIFDVGVASGLTGGNSTIFSTAPTTGGSLTISAEIP